MNKAELIDVVAARLGHSKRDVTDIVEAFIEETKKAVIKGEKVTMSGFGVFERQARRARLGRNPRTGEAIPIQGRRVVTFHASQKLKEQIQGLTAAASD